MAPAWQFGLVGVLAVALATDIKSHKIYNWLTFPAMLAGLALSVAMGGVAGLQSSLVGFFVGSLVFLIGFMIGGMGGGDVKLMAAVGLWLGWPATLGAVLYVTIVGGLASVGVAIANGTLLTMLKNVYWSMVGLLVPGGSMKASLQKSAAPPFPYGVSIALGVTLALFFPDPQDLFALMGLR